MSGTHTRNIGIDFGTSTTLIAERRTDGVPNVLPIGETRPWIPSLVGIGPSGKLVVGEEAARLQPERVIPSVKSALTRGEQEVSIPAGTVAVHDAVAAILSEAISRARGIQHDYFDDAEVYLGCPALWTGAERLLLVDVVDSLGLDVDIGQIIDEPVAAGLAWIEDRWLHAGDRPGGKAVIFDAGGGTLDIAYVDVVGDTRPEMTVLSAEGVAEAGDALDRSMADELWHQLPRFDRHDELLRRLVLNRARDLKEALTYDAERTVPVGEPFEAVLQYSRNQLDRVFEAQLNRAVRLVQSTVRGSLLRVDQPVSPSEIRAIPWSDLAAEAVHVVLVGGMSQVRAVPRELARVFPGSRIEAVDRPQESVVRGLVHGDRLVQLNLPRPPVNFCVEYHNDRVDPAWADAHRVVYEAFTPLYRPDELANGQSHLGFSADIAFPPTVSGVCEITVRCEVPDRDRTLVTLRSRNRSDGTVGYGDGIKLRHDGRSRAYLKLYTNGDLVLHSSKSSYQARVRHWPRIRGRTHDWVREIEIEQKAATGPSELLYDNWRFQ